MSKGKGLRVWACDNHVVYARTPKEVADRAMTDLVFNANKSFGYYEDCERDCTVTVGVNKPADMPLLGIKWEDLGAYQVSKRTR